MKSIKTLKVNLNDLLNECQFDGKTHEEMKKMFIEALDELEQYRSNPQLTLDELKTMIEITVEFSKVFSVEKEEVWIRN